MRITRRLNIASNFYGQFAIVFPLLAGGTTLFLRCDPDGRADADLLRVWQVCKDRCRGLSTRLPIWLPGKLR
ncbi:Uncharacterised protein [Serratia fonticola]|uniref:Uncharacterized protein n=1 Tax=Serratia fonticola TaxID=47917 RepID=A0A4U9VBH8_SERFO|nr:Uncharacterised protein [Serratia fonticola]